ncbi:MAG: alpha/beta hydrolase [Sphingomicrobium sp.]
MNRIFIAALALALAVTATPGLATVPAYSAAFHSRDIAVNGTTIHVRVAGSGPAVVLLHGYGESGDMWAPLAAKLMVDRTVIVPDLRGMGLSSKPAGGFTKMNQAADIAGLLVQLKIGRTDIVAHDIGNMVAFAFAEKYADRTGKVVLIDAPVPGIGPWEKIIQSPLLWHFRFGGPDMERLVKGRERIYLDRFWNDFSADPKNFDEASRVHYAKLYALPGAMHSGFEQFHAFDQDAIDNRAWIAAHGKLKEPILALGGEKSFGPGLADVIREGADNVTGGVVPSSGHWIMEENPEATVRLVTDFLAKP